MTFGAAGVASVDEGFDAVAADGIQPVNDDAAAYPEHGDGANGGSGP